MLLKIVGIVAFLAYAQVPAIAADAQKNTAINTARLNNGKTREYIITGVQRGDDRPWLFYASSRSESPDWHSIGFSTSHDDVEIDGRRFSYVDGKLQVLTRRGGELHIRKVAYKDHESLRWIRNRLEGITFCKADAVIQDVFCKNKAAEPCG